MKKRSLAREEEDKLKVFAPYAKGEKRADHAIGINVNEDGVCMVPCSLKCVPHSQEITCEKFVRIDFT